MEKQDKVQHNAADNEVVTEAPPEPNVRRKSSKSRRKLSGSKDESKLQLLASDGQIPAEKLSQMASKMIDTVLHNYEPSTNEAAPTPSISSTKKKKSKASFQKIESSPKPDNQETNQRSHSADKLKKLGNCLECEWTHNYHPCLLSDSKDNTKCKVEMKRKGYDYEEPKSCCKKSTGSVEGTLAIKSTKPSSEITKKQQPSETQSKQKIKTKVQPPSGDPKIAKGELSKQSQVHSPNVPNPNVKPSKPKATKIAPSTKKLARVNFEAEKSSTSVAPSKVENKPLKSAMASDQNVRPTSSRLVNNTLDFLNKLNSKSTTIPHAAKPELSEKHSASVPVSTRASRSRFNVRQPSPSAIHLPPEMVSAHELKCKTFDPLTSQCICESAAAIAVTPKQSVKSKKTAKAKLAGDEKLKEVETLIADGNNTACGWQKNYHPCDKLNKKCDKSSDRQVCKVWRKGKNEADSPKSASAIKCNSQSVTDPNSTLTTTPSEKAYIDKVVRTAVKLAKKNINGNCRKPRSKNRRECSVSSEETTAKSISSGFTQANSINSMVNNAIITAASQVKQVKKSKTKKVPGAAPALSVAGAATSSPKKKINQNELS